MKTTLLIHDDPFRAELADTLSRLGHMVIARNNASSSLAALGNDNSIDLIVMDCRTNGMDFLDLLGSLKKLAPAVPSIMLTENGNIETYLRACHLGVFEYLNKPVKAEEIARVVGAALLTSQRG